MRRVIAGVLAAIGVLVVVVGFRTFSLPSRQLAPAEGVTLLEVDAAAAAERLASGVRYRTVSHFDPANLDRGAFLALHAYLGRTFPRVHASLGRERLGEPDLTLLYTWPGSDPSLAPILFLAHQDVVPVPAGTEEKWTRPAYEGVIADGFVWGRGTMDDKGNLFAQLEAVEALLAAGFVPTRTVMLAFGHDEEVGGTGAVAVAEHLAGRGIRPAFVLDEGMAVIEGVVPGLERPAAMIGVAEKGYLSLRLSVSQDGGHSSTPPRHTAVGVLAQAVTRVEANPLPARLQGVGRDLFGFLAPEMPLRLRAVFANLWIFEPLVIRFLEGNPGTNALVRTSTAVTMIQGSPKDNVLPSEAWAVVNHRVLPGDELEDVTGHVRAAVGDERVRVEPIGKPQAPSPISDPGSPNFALLQRTVSEVFPEAVVAPALVLGGTDARHLTPVSDDVYRFSPYRFGPGDLPRVHGIDERVAVEGHADAIRFFARLISVAAGPPAP